MNDSKPTVLITGASSGIGEALAWVFAEHKYNLVLVARSTRKLQTLAKAIKKEYQVTATVETVDLSRSGSAAKLHDSLIEKAIIIDVLVNNAGVLKHGRFVEQTGAEHQGMIQLNIASLTDMLSQFLPDMVSRGSGKVMNIASVAAFQPFASLATYAATKAYVLSLSESLMEELRGTGVTLTAVCPGITATNLVEAVTADNDALTKLPSAMIGDAREVAVSAYEACMREQALVVPGAVNLAATMAARATPKWLLRRITGMIGRASLYPSS